MKPSTRKQTVRHAKPISAVPRGTDRLQTTTSAATIRTKQILQNLLLLLSHCWKRVKQLQNSRATRRSLRLEETVALGQKRFVAVIKVDGQRFLIGVGSEISLLASFQPEPPFAQVLQESEADAVGARTKACA